MSSHLMCARDQNLAGREQLQSIVSIQGTLLMGFITFGTLLMPLYLCFFTCPDTNSIPGAAARAVIYCVATSEQQSAAAVTATVATQLSGTAAECTASVTTAAKVRTSTAASPSKGFSSADAAAAFALIDFVCSINHCCWLMVCTC